VKRSCFAALVTLVALAMIPLAASESAKVSACLGACTASWHAFTASPESVVVRARAANSCSGDLRVAGGLLFKLKYVPTAWSESMLVVRQDSVRKNVRGFVTSDGQHHYRCGEWPEFPRVIGGAGRFSLASPAVRVLHSGEALQDTFVFELDRRRFREWPGVVVVECSVWDYTGKGDRPWEIYAPEKFRVRIPVP
jgi:hypothetical protein